MDKGSPRAFTCRRAFTYLEMAVVMGLLGIFLVLGVGLARSSHGRPQSRTASQVLAAFLRCQRERARATGQPVAVVWPSQTGTTAVSSACEALSGWDRPVRVDHLDLEREFPDTAMFVGRWPTQTLTFSQQRPQWGSQDDDWDPALYLPNRAEDPALIFLPSGKVTARKCWRLGDNYVLLVGQRLQAQSQLLQAAGPCFTLRVSPGGWVDSLSQVLDAQLASVGGAGQQVAPLPAHQVVAQGPTLQRLVIQPDPARLKLPGGVDALVAADGFLTLITEAQSPSGQSLYLSWSDSSAPKGVFSSQQRRPMHWSPERNCWRGEIHWRPPATVSDGERFRLTCHVTDEEGREAPQSLTGQVDLQVSNSKARMAFVSVAPAPDNSHRFQVVNEDGTGKRQLPARLLTNGSEPPKASWSPDGTRLAYLSRDNGVNRLWTCNADGSGSRMVDQALAGTAVAMQGVHWSPDGTWLAHIRELPSGRRQVFVIHPDGSGAVQLNTGSHNDDFVRHIAGSGLNSNVVSRDNSVFSADGRYLACIIDSQSIQCYPMPGSGAPPITIPSDRGSWSVVWNPVKPWLAFANSGGLKIYDTQAACFFQVPPASDQYAAGPGCFSPDGRRYLYGRGNDLFLADLNASDHSVVVSPLSIQGQMMGWLDDQRFTRWNPDPSDLFVHDLDTHTEQNLTNEASDSMFCGWTL